MVWGGSVWWGQGEWATEYLLHQLGSWWHQLPDFFIFFFDKYFSPLGSQLLGDRSHVLEMKCSTLLGQGFSPMFVPLFWIFYGYSLSFHRIENKRNGLQYSLDLELSFWYQTSVFAAKLCMLWSYLSCRSFVPHLNNMLLSVYWFSYCLFCPCFFHYMLFLYPWQSTRYF